MVGQRKHANASSNGNSKVVSRPSPPCTTLRRRRRRCAVALLGISISVLFHQRLGAISPCSSFHPSRSRFQNEKKKKKKNNNKERKRKRGKTRREKVGDSFRMGNKRETPSEKRTRRIQETCSIARQRMSRDTALSEFPALLDNNN